MRPIALSGYRELAREFEEDPRGALVNLREHLEEKTLTPEMFSLRQLFESTVEDGRSLLDAMDPRRKGFIELREAANAIDLGTFANITGQIIFSKIKDAYQSPNFLWTELVTQQQTPFPYGERIPGIGPVGDKMDVVGEGEGYPVAGVNEEYVDIPATGKKGLITNITREAIVFDRTGLVLQRAADLGFSFGLQIEKRVLDIATGQVNNYKRNGVATNTYLTSGAYINSTTGNSLTDWTSIQTLELLFDGITDPNTGEPIILEAANLLVPSALKRTANRILMSSEVAHVDNTVSATTIRTFSPSPMANGFYGQQKYGVLSNAFVKTRTSSATNYFFGDFKKAFARFYNWDMEITQASDNNYLMFQNDIWVRNKVSSRDIIAVLEPRYVAKSTP